MRTLTRLAELTAEREVGLFLIGDPLHMSGDQSRQAQYIRDFAARLTNVREYP